MIITILGRPGSGKTTAAKKLADILDYKHISGGDIRGEIAAKHGMTIDELNEIGMKEDWTDKEVDDYLVNLGKTEDNYVIDSWTAFYFIPESLKFFIECDPTVAALRVYEHQRPDEKHHDSPDGVMDMLNYRWEQSRQRYKKYYGFDINDLSNYDVVIDSTAQNQQQVTDEMLGYIKERM